MNKPWKYEFRQRMDDFQILQKGGHALSIKIRIDSGCFERRCSPRAWNIIDTYLLKNHSSINDVRILEHESGPELLVYLAITTAGITLAKSIIDLIIVIIKATDKGKKSGDKARLPIEIIIRRIKTGNEYREELICRVDNGENVDHKDIENSLKKGIDNLFRNNAS